MNGTFPSETSHSGDGGLFGRSKGRLQSNCIVSVAMGYSSDGSDDGFPSDMEVSQTKKARKKSWSEASSGGENTPRQVNKKIKAKPKGSSRPDDDKQEEWKVIITLSNDKGHFHPVHVTKAIEKDMGKIKYAKLLNNRRILISAVNKKQQEMILKMSNLGGGNIKVHVPGTTAKLRGVITNVPLEMSVEDVKSEIKNGNVLEVKRLQNNKNGVKSDSLSVMIIFEKSLPCEVQIGWINYKVREYIPQPLRCFKCQRMGHTVQQCKWRQRCAKCGGEHEYGKCNKDTKLQCCNCGGEHSAAYAGCVVQKQAKEVQRYKVVNKVSYAEAIKNMGKYETKENKPTKCHENLNESAMHGAGLPQRLGKRRFQPGPVDTIPATTQQPCKHKCIVEENTLMVEKKSFIAFICKVVNVATRQERKSDRIKTVVEAAEEFLGIKDLKAEEIHGMLSTNNDGGSQSII